MQGAIASEGVRLPATAINLTATGLSDKTFAYSSSKGAIVDMSWSGGGVGGAAVLGCRAVWWWCVGGGILGQGAP